MALLSLQNIGKIYVSEGSVAVGIRGVNLSFDRGEFVSVTGESGSGKSTLLNVISGMDSYEEGELLINGEPTSYFTEADREEYREKYISFIFQDYNILESFTVLQNVELALLSIRDPKERRERALELIRRVGLEKQLRQKGSRLSGGQKQRTVIARALAKDSPIILADEPTGNLDSGAAAEIIALLREVSKDKLVIVVTHSPEETAAYATREIRVYDGAVVSDHVLAPVAESTGTESFSDETATVKASGTGISPEEKRARRKRTRRDGFTLGKALFAAKPRLSLYLCFLMLIGLGGLFLMTSLCGDIPGLLRRPKLFTHIPGRVVITRSDGEVITEAELKEIAEKSGAERFLHYDCLLDAGYIQLYLPEEESYTDSLSVRPYTGSSGKLLGRQPEEPDEVLLRLPISYEPLFGRKSFTERTLSWNGMNLLVTGVEYYYDNNLPGQLLATEEGIRLMTAYSFLSEGYPQWNIVLLKGDDILRTYTFDGFLPDFSMEGEKLYSSEQGILSALSDKNTDIAISFSALHFRTYFGGEENSFSFKSVLGKDSLTAERGEYEMLAEPGTAPLDPLFVSPALLTKLAAETLAENYHQASLFYADDKAAEEAAELLHGELGYIAVPSDACYSALSLNLILNTVSGLFELTLWALSVIFLSFFIHLCSGKAVESFRGDLAILRSMGIRAGSISAAIYVRMFFSMLPAYAVMALTAVLIFTSPKINGFFTYLYFWQYLLIGLGLILIAVRVSRKQAKKLFGESVKAALRGGEDE